MVHNRHNLGLLHGLASLAVLLISPIAGADAEGPATLVTRSPVPANGVLRFSTDDERVVVRIVAASGVEVPGRFVASRVWRPDQPFEIGTYTADLTFDPNPKLAEDKEFEVIPAMEPSTDFIDIEVSSRIDAGEVLAQVCCQSGAADVDMQPCTDDCAPLCVPLSYAALHMVAVHYASDSESPLAQQTIIRKPSYTAPGQYVEGVWSVDGAPENLCGVAEIFSWLDESVVQLETCVVNPKPDLNPIAETVTSFGRISECTVPPAGYESEWCTAQDYTCSIEVETLAGTEREALATACKEYYRLCGGSIQMPSTDSGTVGENETDTSDETSVGFGEPEESEPRAQKSVGCECATHRGQRSDVRVLSLIALMAVAFAHRRSSAPS